MATSSIDRDIFLRDFNELRNTNDLLSYRMLYKYLTDATAIDPALETRLQTLENNEVKVTYYQSISSTTGTVTPITGATILLDQFEGADALLAKITGGVVQGDMPVDSGGAYVDVATFNASGDWTLTGTPASTPYAIIFMIKIKFKDYVNLNIANILEETDNNEVTVNTAQTITGLKTIKPSSTSAKGLILKSNTGQLLAGELLRAEDDDNDSVVRIRQNGIKLNLDVQGYVSIKNIDGIEALQLFTNASSSDMIHFHDASGVTVFSKVDSVGDFIAPNEAFLDAWNGNLAVPTKDAIFDRDQSKLGRRVTFRVTEAGAAITTSTEVFNEESGVTYTWYYDGVGLYHVEASASIWDTTKTYVEFGAATQAIIANGFFPQNFYTITSPTRIDFRAFDMVSATDQNGMWIDQIIKIITNLN